MKNRISNPPVSSLHLQICRPPERNDIQLTGTPTDLVHLICKAAVNTHQHLSKRTEMACDLRRSLYSIYFGTIQRYDDDNGGENGAARNYGRN
ncbi:uncharacterized protein LOC134203438 isoform X2 [Armigeres subalbatus]|uniref:uncharacterized protein LOC134203438 isoform X2 n=1 Tax=Armigeres subalbatus TaxID=124917 RepID=UPI002ED468D4